MMLFFGGLAVGMVVFTRLVMALGLADFGDPLARERQEKLLCMPKAEREAFLAAERVQKARDRRKRAYVRAMERLCAEVRRRRIAEWRRTGVDPDLRAANSAWRDLGMDRWLDIHMASDAPLVDPSDGGTIDYSRVPSAR